MKRAKKINIILQTRKMKTLIIRITIKTIRYIKKNEDFYRKFVPVVLALTSGGCFQGRGDERAAIFGEGQAKGASTLKHSRNLRLQ